MWGHRSQGRVHLADATHLREDPGSSLIAVLCIVSSLLYADTTYNALYIYIYARARACVCVCVCVCVCARVCVCVCGLACTKAHIDDGNASGTNASALPPILLSSGECGRRVPPHAPPPCTAVFCRRLAPRLHAGNIGCRSPRSYHATPRVCLHTY